MEVQPVELHRRGMLSTLNLSETVVAPLANAQQREKFVF